MSIPIYWRAWGQNPTRSGRTFTTEAEAVAWAEAEAPQSDGWSFIQHSRTGELRLYRAETGRWS